MKKHLLAGAIVAGGAALALRRLAPALRALHEHCREAMRGQCGHGERTCGANPT